MADGDRVRVGVLGLGSIAQVVHLPILSQLPNAELAGVCDVDRTKAKAIAARFGIPRVFQSDEEVFRSEELDALVICTPSHLHEAQAVAALESGKHTLVEKPLAMTEEGAARVVAAAEAAGRTLQVAITTVSPDCRRSSRSRKAVSWATFRSRRMAEPAVRTIRPTWQHRRATAGSSAFMDLGVNPGPGWWLLGFPSVDVCASVSAGGWKSDSATVILRLNGGCISLSVAGALSQRDLTDGCWGPRLRHVAPLAVFRSWSRHDRLTPPLPTPGAPVYRTPTATSCSTSWRRRAGRSRPQPRGRYS
jgi:predicted dehydrogenase